MLNINCEYKKGAEVFVEWLRAKGGLITPKPITSIGRKYITVEVRHRPVKFTLKGHEVSDYQAYYELWSSIEECNNARFKERLRTATRSKLDVDRYIWMDKFSNEELATFAERIGVSVDECRKPIIAEV
jgi:hypothetical protein